MNAIDAMLQNAHKTYINLTQLSFGFGSSGSFKSPNGKIEVRKAGRFKKCIHMNQTE